MNDLFEHIENAENFLDETLSQISQDNLGELRSTEQLQQIEATIDNLSKQAVGFGIAGSCGLFEKLRQILSGGGNTAVAAAYDDIARLCTELRHTYEALARMLFSKPCSHQSPSLAKI